jgi:non-ribosomal peptide synthetase component F
VVDKSTVLKSVHTLSTSLTENLNHFARENHVTVNTILQAAWSYLLFTYSREDKVVFGSTISGRTEEFEATVGMLINTIPAVVTLSPSVKVR